jgi:cytochrome c oxidase subunit 2
VAVSGVSEDVIHSFWSPQLSGKMDFIPGKPNEFVLRADKAGTYRGQCAEFCGVGHAKMAFYVVAESRTDFDAWLAAQARPADAPAGATAQRGEQIFMGSSCSVCHGIAGTDAKGRVGPDLTHLASRDTFAGGSAKITADNLADWVTDPSSIKPGATMPATQLDRDSLVALVAYLESLQ